MRRPARPFVHFYGVFGALLLLQLATGCEDKASAALGRGNLAAKSGKLTDAAAAYEEAVKAAPENARAYELLGHAEYELGRTDDARRAYENALQRAPSSIAARVGLARLDGDAGKRDSAIEQLRSILSSAPDDLLALTSHAALCVNRAGPGDLDAALKDTGRALELSPNDARALYVRGNALLAQNKSDEAKLSFEQLQRAHPSSPLGDYGLARVAAAKGDRLSALTQLRSALDRAKGQPGVLPLSSVRADPAFHFLEADADFAQLVPPP